MGSTQSSEQKTSTPNSPASGTGVRSQSSRAKESLQPLSRTTSRQSSNSSTPAFEPTRSSTPTTGSGTAKSTHTRARSITAPGPAPQSRSTETTGSQKSTTSIKDDDRVSPAVRSATLPIAAQRPTADTGSPASRPVDVPSAHLTTTEHESSVPEIDVDDSIYGHGPSDYSRPPRLPLPIEEEIYTPGSPIISSHDVSSPIDEKDADGIIPRRTSVLSSTTVDDDEVADHEAFATDHSLAPTVPTIIEWMGHGERVYVTGTFVMWEKKFKLHRNPKTGHFSATIPLKPGTHHVKFLVDNDMITSDDLPTTVDFTNILVNYIEVVSPKTDATEHEEKTEAEQANDEILPGTAISEGQAAISIDQPPSEPIPIPSSETQPESGEAPASVKAQSLHEPIPITSVGSRPRPPSPSSRPQSEQQPQKPARQLLPRAEYTTQIPQFMLDLDRYHTPEDERYQRAYRVSSTLPAPPSLPLFLAKSILNGTTPHKDDASVLNMPNHTVLNHLATSSIRHNVLATSGTTRYKRKFLTTIMYRPTSDDG